MDYDRDYFSKDSLSCVTQNKMKISKFYSKDTLFKKIQFKRLQKFIRELPLELQLLIYIIYLNDLRGKVGSYHFCLSCWDGPRCFRHTTVAEWTFDGKPIHCEPWLIYKEDTLWRNYILLDLIQK